MQEIHQFGGIIARFWCPRGTFYGSTEKKRPRNTDLNKVNFNFFN